MNYRDIAVAKLKSRAVDDGHDYVVEYQHSTNEDLWFVEVYSDYHRMKNCAKDFSKLNYYRKHVHYVGKNYFSVYW